MGTKGCVALRLNDCIQKINGMMKKSSLRLKAEKRKAEKKDKLIAANNTVEKWDAGNELPKELGIQSRQEKGINGVQGSVVSGSRSFADSTSIFPQEPMPNTMHVIAMATIQSSHLIICFVFFL